MSSSQLAQVNDAVSQISRGKDVNEDSWMVMWCNTNWGELLQPAPLSIALLGSLMVISSSTNDFSLISEDDSFKFTYAKHPTSFKTCLQQMVGDGYSAFETASHQMMRINNASSQLPDAIKRAVTIIIQSQSPMEIQHLLPHALSSISELTDICIDASRSCEEGFVRISSLAQEILECTTHKIGSAEQTTGRNETHLFILKQQEEEEQRRVQESKEMSELMKKSFVTAEQDFRTAVDTIPPTWKIVGAHIVDSLLSVITGPVNALLGKAIANRLSQSSSSSSAEKTTQPSGPELSDPGISLVQQILYLVSDLNLLISGGVDGKPDWDNIRGSNNKSGGLFVEANLERIMIDRLDSTKPISSKLLPIVNQSVEIAKKVNKTARGLQSGDDTVLDKYKPTVNKMIEDLQVIMTECNLILQQTGNVATGPGTPKNVSTNTGGSARAVVESAKFRVDQIRAQLEAARESYQRVSSRLMEEQRETTKTISTMTKLSLENATLREILPVLKEAIRDFTKLRAQVSQMTQLFCSVASLVNDVMRPQVMTLVKHIEGSSQIALAGVTLPDWMRHAIYAQMMGPLKVSMLAERISGTYLRVSDLYIMPAQREVGHMLQFQEDRSDEGKRQFTLKLEQARQAINEKAQMASQKILELVADDQKKFVGTINQRLGRIQDTVGRTLPAIKEPIPRQIAEVTAAHVEEVDSRRETESYLVEELM